MTLRLYGHGITKNMQKQSFKRLIISEARKTIKPTSKLMTNDKKRLIIQLATLLDND